MSNPRRPYVTPIESNYRSKAELEARKGPTEGASARSASVRPDIPSAFRNRR